MSKTTTQCIYWGEIIHLQSTNRTSQWFGFLKMVKLATTNRTENWWQRIFKGKWIWDSFYHTPIFLVKFMKHPSKLTART